MQIRTVSVAVSAPRDTVFNFLADIENLPQWATEFCERIELRHDGWWAYTTQGEMIVASDTDDRTGVIDLRVGPSESELGLFPVRVFSLSENRTLVSFTFIQTPELSDDRYESQYHAWVVELWGLIRRFGGGELYAPGTVPQLDALGLN
jgi:hypothetical protein